MCALRKGCDHTHNLETLICAVRHAGDHTHNLGRNSPQLLCAVRHDFDHTHNLERNSYMLYIMGVTTPIYRWCWWLFLRLRGL